jgi:hypothetical protein
MLELLFEALMSEYGVVVECDEPLRLRAKLYTERVKDPQFKCLSFALSPDNPKSELWIIKTKEPLDGQS